MKNVTSLLMCILLMWACTQSKIETTSQSPPAPTEFADSTYTIIGQEGLRQLAEGNVDGFVSHFADNVVFRWNNLDSIAGKQAVTEYWKDRRSNLIDTLSYEPEIWLGVKANQPQKGVEPGVYLFNWIKVDVKYVNGKSVNMWIHHVYHFNDAKKIDVVNQFLDRAPINAALAKK